MAVNAAPQKVDFGKLPKNSQEFIQKNFPGEKVKAVEMDREASWDKYTVYFNSGNQVSKRARTAVRSKSSPIFRAVIGLVLSGVR